MVDAYGYYHVQEKPGYQAPTPESLDSLATGKP